VFDSSPRRYLTFDEEWTFGAVNKIDCALQNGMHAQATAPLVIRKDIALTAAHLFYNEETHGQSLLPQDCVYIVYDQCNHIVDRVPLAEILSRWVDTQSRGDETRDLAIIKLSRPANIDGQPLRIAVLPPNPRTQFEIVGFQMDMSNDNRRVASVGQIYKKVGSRQEFKPTMIIHDASAVEGSSGAPLIEKQSQVAMGLHIGWAKGLGQDESHRFDRLKNYNRAIAFDPPLIQEIDALASTKDAKVDDIRSRAGACLERGLEPDRNTVATIVVNIIQIAMYSFAAIGLVMKIVSYINYPRNG